MNKKIKIIITSILIIICIILGLLFTNKDVEIKTIKSEKELSRMYEGDDSITKERLMNILTMPFSFLVNGFYSYSSPMKSAGMAGSSEVKSGTETLDSVDIDLAQSSSSSSSDSITKDFSTTNIQVENVDEADITKTDGDYIYSISENNVIITDVINPKEIKIVAIMKSNDESIPEDLILYKNELVVISTKTDKNSSSYYNYNDTIVKIYNIDTKTNPILIKSYELNEPYYTSRCINNMLYVISSGKLRKEDNKIIRNYKEDKIEHEIELENIKYLKDVKTNKQTLISVVDLDNAKADINVSSYLIDISNAYVSEKSIYLLDEKYDYNSYAPPISTVFGLKGIIGVFTYDDENEISSGYKTEIYKFDITKDGNVAYNTKNEIEGKTINQYSLDEQNGHLRIALYDNNGARVAICDENLKQIGVSSYVGKGEKMYSSRFMNNKAYLVTYKTIDPLFVIDLSNETKPQVLGELSIPGYSTYLHPYDENHLIGIGMETEEIVNKNSSGKVISTTARIIGMKMALFDVTDVNNPVQISQTIIGDKRTTSAILTNPKALLFSKERELIAIPVNNYREDFEIKSSSDTYSSIVNAYTNYDKSYIAEGYFVYKINIEEGFNLKGIITHENSTKNKSSYYYYNRSKLLRGLYIDDNLYTISEIAIKVNNLETLELIDELKIKQ